MDDENVANFVAITSCDPAKAAQYLQLTDHNLEQAIQLFFDSPNLDVGGSSAPQPPAAATATTHAPIQIDSDDDMDFGDDLPSDTPPAFQPNVEDDEAMARRLQEEMYGTGAGGAGGLGQDEVRAPIDRRTETLVGPGANWGPEDDGDEDVDALVREQLARRRGGGRPGIFNQRTAQTAVWEDTGDSSVRRRELATATGGASEQSNKMSMLAELFRPPFELMFQQSWEKARDEGKEQEKWIIVNIQDPAIFDCQRLNRDIWKNDDIKATVRENFIFMQYAKDDPRGQEYNNYYFHARDSADAYPHIAIVDPRTGEQVKVWSGPPIPEPVDFHAELHEFLDRYSLSATAKNPVAMRKSEKKKVDPGAMTEDEQMAMALQNSLDNNQGPKDEDPDSLTKGDRSDKGKGKADEEMTEPSSSNSPSPFDLISSTSPHTEPSADPATTTRVQFRGGPGRPIVRRFKLSDPVRTLYEWIKADHPWEGKEGAVFDLSFTGKNLMDHLDSTIEEAGLKNASVMVEFVEE
jgi:hypothetical protein